MTTPQCVHPSNRRPGDPPACPQHCPLARITGQRRDTGGMTRFCARRESAD